MFTAPLQFSPLLKRIRWGGRRLGTRLGKPLGPENDYAESWELVDHGQDQSRVISGPWTGRTLQELVQREAKTLLGTQAGLEQFPLLVKFLDAHDRLSVQVHPNDRQAAAAIPGERGKTEAWVILEAEPEAYVFAGLKPGVDRAALARAVETGTVEQCLHRLEVRPGDCIFIPAGTVPGWGSIARERLVAADYFTLDRLQGTGTATLPPASHSRIWIIVAGAVRWGATDGDTAGLGSTLLWAAATGPVELQWSPGTVVIEATWP